VAGKNERQRRQARERYRRQQELRVARRRKLRTRLIAGLSVAAAAGLVVALLVLFIPGSGKKASASASTSASASASASTVAEPAHHCSYTKATPVAKKVTFPPSTPDYTASYTATINTNLGKIELNLLNSKATCTVNSFVHLAEQGYFNNTLCHRIVTSGPYVVQCGDPYATTTAKLDCSETSDVGTGTPGYNFASENLKNAKYPAGTVAMASDSATTNGSQFFIVYKDSTSTLEATYTPFATVTSGLDILQNVVKGGTSCTYAQVGGGVPKKKVIIDSVTISTT
jgi:peptidyl-prolyl cis-trans isomerase B (cyclophilin B)